ncbi:MAG: hypothetical protein E7527_01185 [Ruminococcaceae bacterium]|nr:hypothetical protein [Oscillospiraceae bacterium]
MAMGNKQKNKLRHVIRVFMVTMAVIMLFWGLVLPVINNAVALGIENDLKEALVNEQHLQVVDSISAAGRFFAFSNDMQYFGAVLVTSDLSEAELEAYFEKSLFYKKYNCSYEKQTSAKISLSKTVRNMDLSFDRFPESTCYMIYRWGQPSEWVRPLLNTDLR